MTIPAYMSRTTLAEQLDVAPSTVDELVKRGVLPKPVKLSSGCVRWSWASVEAALASLAFPTETEPLNPFMKAAQNAKEILREKRRGST
jgi:predicted DNA-binding transcriptional regulator AlpA